MSGRLPRSGLGTREGDAERLSGICRAQVALAAPSGSLGLRSPRAPTPAQKAEAPARTGSATAPVERERPLLPEVGQGLGCPGMGFALEPGAEQGNHRSSGSIRSGVLPSIPLSMSRQEVAEDKPLALDDSPGVTAIGCEKTGRRGRRCGTRRSHRRDQHPAEGRRAAPDRTGDRRTTDRAACGSTQTSTASKPSSTNSCASSPVSPPEREQRPAGGPCEPLLPIGADVLQEQIGERDRADPSRGGVSRMREPSAPRRPRSGRPVGSRPRRAESRRPPPGASSSRRTACMLIRS